jgi:hypothetical protein
LGLKLAGEPSHHGDPARIEAKALAVRESPPRGDVMTMSDIAADVELPMERHPYVPGDKLPNIRRRMRRFRRGCDSALFLNRY